MDAQMVNPASTADWSENHVMVDCVSIVTFVGPTDPLKRVSPMVM
jgi:hypothetical protein